MEKPSSRKQRKEHRNSEGDYSDLPAFHTETHGRRVRFVADVIAIDGFDRR